jgi:membrane protease YdiL (CAAX protease family)
MSEGQSARTGDARRLLIITAWVVILAVSDLPDIVWNALTGRVPAPLFWAKVAVLAFFLGMTLLVKALRPLRPYALVLAIFYLVLGLTSLIRNTAWFQGHFNSPGISFFKGFMALYVLDIGVALAVITVLWILKRDRRAIFMTKGRLDAPIEPVRWLGIREGGSWRTFGWIFACVAALAVLIPTLLAIAPSGATMVKALPLLPAVLLFAAINAFTEEVYYRAGLLATLTEVIGKGQTLLLAAVFFGLGHWLSGSPPGLVGFLMTGFLAWLLGKSMLETRGIAWPWLIHFLPDVVIFISYALLRVKA